MGEIDAGGWRRTGREWVEENPSKERRGRRGGEGEKDREKDRARGWGVMRGCNGGGESGEWEREVWPNSDLLICFSISLSPLLVLEGEHPPLKSFYK